MIVYTRQIVSQGAKPDNPRGPHERDLTTLVSFNGTNGAVPVASLIADANGDLFGTTVDGGAQRRRHGVRDRQDRHWLRQHPHHPGQLQRHRRRVSVGSLIADANGDLFGTTSMGRRERRRHGVRDRQDRHRLRQHPHHPGQLQRHQRCVPAGSLIADANGDLFGTT